MKHRLIPQLHSRPVSAMLCNLKWICHQSGLTWLQRAAFGQRITAPSCLPDLQWPYTVLDEMPSAWEKVFCMQVRHNWNLLCTLLQILALQALSHIQWVSTAGLVMARMTQLLCRYNFATWSRWSLESLISSRGRPQVCKGAFRKVYCGHGRGKGAKKECIRSKLMSCMRDIVKEDESCTFCCSL